MNASLPTAVALVCLLIAPIRASAATFIYDPQPYRQTSDSPFYAAYQAGKVYLEDFTVGNPGEHVFQTSYISAPNGALGTFSGYYSVDGDDGVLDGFGKFGGSWSVEGASGATSPNGDFVKARFDFAPGPNGTRPHSVGVVLTHLYSITLMSPVRFRAFDSLGMEITDGRVWASMPTSLQGSLGAAFYTADARFVSVVSDREIATITLESVTFLDHIQYSFDLIPEPATGSLAVLAGSLALTRRRRSWQRCG